MADASDADPIKTGGAVEQKFTSSSSDDNDEDIASKKHADVSPKPKNKRSTDDLSSSSTQSSYGTRGGYTEYKSKEKQKVNESKEKFFNMSLKDKRRLYKCKDKFITLDEIDTWPEYFDQELKDQEVVNSWWKRNEKKVKYEIDNDLSNKISLFRGDITTLEIDAIANAANESLLGGGGVDGAIHSAAGIKLLSECELLDRCPAGEARITCGYKLPARHVIHTVGPRGEYPEKLESCYRESLKLLKENDLKSVAFPCISTGIFGYPNENAAKVALKTVRDWLENEEYSKNVERIIFCLFLKKDVEIYHEQLQLFFPLNRNDDSRSRSEETSF